MFHITSFRPSNEFIVIGPFSSATSIFENYSNTDSTCPAIEQAAMVLDIQYSYWPYVMEIVCSERDCVITFLYLQFEL